MIKSISGLVIQIALVVAGVIVFSYFDPFGLLSPRKQTLHDTPITVVSIREIGQLVTAEYYGEVLSTLQDSLVAEIKAGDKQAAMEFMDLNTKYIAALKDLYFHKSDIPVRWYKRRQDLTDYFYSTNQGLINSIYYQDMIAMILKKNKDYGDEGDLLLSIWKLKDVIEHPTFETKCAVDTISFNKEKKKELAELKGTRAFKKRQIIGLGRGWVKAGIDFGTFTDKNFKYDREKKTIYLLGIVPKILNCDINPWFIPERKVKGFEIIAATNKANDPKFLLKVKGSCLTKLRAQAEANGIIKQAKINAEQSLKDFFSLLLTEPIEDVKIMENPFELYANMFPAKKIIPGERLLLLDSVLLSLRNIDTTSAFNKAGEFSKMKWTNGFDTLRVNRYSYSAYYLAENKALTSEEWKQVSEQLNNATFSRLDSLWFFPYESSNSISRSVRVALKSKSDKYAATFWADSVLNKQDYLNFKKKYEANFRSRILDSMTMKRKASQDLYVDYLKKHIKTIDRPGHRAHNSATEIAQCLDSLNSR